MHREPPYSGFHDAAPMERQSRLSTLAEAVAIILFFAGFGCALFGMHEIHLAAQAAMQIGGESQ